MPPYSKKGTTYSWAVAVFVTLFMLCCIFPPTSSFVAIRPHHSMVPSSLSSSFITSKVHVNGNANINAKSAVFSQNGNSEIEKMEIQKDDDNNNPNNNNNNDNKSILKSPNQIPLLQVSSKCVPNQMSPTSLAYIGDVVYEMCIRCRYVWPTRRTSDLQNVVVAKVRAETQSRLYQTLLDSSDTFPLTKQEQTIISRGRNAGSPKKKSRVPKRLNNNNNNTGQQGPGAYQDSTALEALLGYLYLTDGERCSEVLDFFCDILDTMDEEDGIIR